MNQISLIANNITANWRGNYVLHDISFELLPGENLLVTGASGSGKTLLAKALSNKLFHSGSVKFFENSIEANPSVVFIQQHYHFKNLSNTSEFYYQQRFNSFDSDNAATVIEELQKNLGSDISIASIHSLLNKFGLAHCADSPMLYLSSGEHKRFQIIKALLHSPGILILDEPFTGLDVQSRKQLKIALDELSAKGTKYILICNPADAPSSITHVAQLENGQLKTFSHFIAYSALQQNKEELPGRSIPVQAPVSHFTNAVHFKNVSVSYGEKTILHGINWKIRKGEHWLLKGHNGAGKSTLLSLMTGDNPQAYANEIYLFDKRRGSGESIWDIKKNIGFVSPELQWYFDTTINCFDTVASGLFDTIGLFRKLNHSQEKAVTDWLYYFNLENHAQQLLSNLPAGKQRLALLARAMVKNPPLLILDEPCQGLDEQQKSHFIKVTEALCTNGSRTLIYVSHYMEDVPTCIEHIMELTKGNAKTYTISEPQQMPRLQTHTV